jgi:hypothetical protein
MMMKMMTTMSMMKTLIIMTMKTILLLKMTMTRTARSMPLTLSSRATLQKWYQQRRAKGWSVCWVCEDCMPALPASKHIQNKLFTVHKARQKDVHNANAYTATHTHALNLTICHVKG